MNSTLAAAAVSIFRPLNGLADIGVQKINLQARNRLTILHTSNMYGQLTGLQSHKKMNGLGGLINVHKKINETRNEQVPLLTIHTGNIIGGGDKSEEEYLQFYKQLNAAGYDAVIPGKSDLLKGAKHFENMSLQSGLKVVAGQSNFPGALFPSQVTKKGNNKVGIVQIPFHLPGSSERFSSSYIAGVMNESALKLKEIGGCNIVICMVQSGKEASINLAELSENIDVILSAVNNHSIHNSMVVRNKINHEIIVSSAGSKGTMMSRLDFTFNNEGEKISTGSKSIFIGAAEDGSLAMLKRYKGSVT